MTRNGIRVPYDLVEPIKALPDADRGRLLVAILEYGQSRKLPQFDGMLALAWGLIQPEIDQANGITPPTHKK